MSTTDSLPVKQTIKVYIKFKLLVVEYVSYIFHTLHDSMYRIYNKKIRITIINALLDALKQDIRK